MREAWFLLVIALASFGIAGGVLAADQAIEAGAQRVAVRAADVRFTPAEIRVQAGRIQVVEFTNDDPIFHDWMVEGVANVDAGARPGQTQKIRFRIEQPGTYMILCSVEGHAEAGMIGTLVVEPAE